MSRNQSRRCITLQTISTTATPALLISLWGEKSCLFMIQYRFHQQTVRIKQFAAFKHEHVECRHCIVIIHII